MKNSHSLGSVAASITFFITIAMLLLVQLHVIAWTPETVQHALEVLSVLVLFILFWFFVGQNGTYKIVHLYIFCSLFFATLYVVPFGFLNASDLPGRELYVSVLDWLVSQGGEKYPATLSIIPKNSILSLLALLPLLALFYVAIRLPEKYVRWLIYTALLIASIQSILGLVQYASGNADFYFGITQNGRSAQGTYANRDHFSALPVMILPIALGLMLFSVGRISKKVISRRESAGGRINQVVFFGFVVLLMFLAAIFARSRAGVLLIMVSIFISTIIFSRHIGGAKSVGLAAIFTTIGLGLSATIGLIPVLNRFVGANPVEDERWRIFKHSIEGMQAFFPVGSGPGTFPDIYRAFQPVEQMRFINNAHNDYLELLFETGVLGVFVIVGFIIIYIYGVVQLTGRDWDRFHCMQVAAGIGVLLILLHASVDFIFHEPMNSMLFCFLAGVFLRKRMRI